MQEYFSGEKLFGDNFTLDEIERWFEDERDGYYELVSADKAKYDYPYHALNERNAFAYLPSSSSFPYVLGYGSAYGDEFLPILNRIGKVTIIDPAKGFRVNRLGSVEVNYVQPNVEGTIPFPNETFDLITCLGVLHHIPRVTRAVGEFYRCVKSGGYVLIREPIISLGDWTGPRKALTKRERGIPVRILRDIISNVGFRVIKETKCMFSLIGYLRYFMRRPVYNTKATVNFDKSLSWLFSWNERYHATSWLQKLRPTAAYFVCMRC